MTEHELLLFIVEVCVLFLAARIGGEIATRIKIPMHVGELVMGMALGPSLLGWVWPEAFETLFPNDPEQRALLEVVSWIAIVFLVLLSGLETRLGILRRAQRAAIGGWIGGFGLPFAGGFALGMLAPDALVPASIDRPVFALFLATAMAISAIPVIARILMDLDLFRTRVGMVIISAAVADDTIGWVVLAIVTGFATGGVEAAAIARTLLLTGGFIVFAFTLGRPLVWKAMELTSRLRMPHAQISMMLFVTLAAGALTQAIGVHLVLGAFVAAMLIGRFRRFDPAAVTGLREVGMGFLVPFFFAYTGIKVDLTTLRGSTLVFAGIAVLVACGSKIVGGGLGARLGGLPGWEALAVGFGLNARGAMELVIAAIGLSVGVLDDAGYAIIVMIAVLTTIIAAPSLKACIDRAGPEARQRPRGPRADGAERQIGPIGTGEPASRAERRPPESTNSS